MIRIFPSDMREQVGGTRFRVRRMRPGLFSGHDPSDSGYGPLGLIDHAVLSPGLVVRMHEHRNDEIVSYLWRGEMVHEDSGGHRAILSPGTVMLMNSGRGFSHEESVLEEPVEMLQIFIRPEEADLAPQVQIREVGWPPPHHHWRSLVGPSEKTSPLVVRQEIRVFDRICDNGSTVTAPARAGNESFLYVALGEISLQHHRFPAGTGICGEEGEVLEVTSLGTTLLVLFHIAKDARFIRRGTLSG